MANSSDIATAAQSAIFHSTMVNGEWNPFQYILKADGSVIDWVSTFITNLTNVGFMILGVLFALRLVKAFIDEFNGIPSTTYIIGAVVELALVVIFLKAYHTMAMLFPDVMNGIAKHIAESSQAGLGKEWMDSLRMIGNEAKEDTSWFSLTALKQTVLSGFAALCAILALVVTMLMALYQAIMFSVWYFLGPILVPFFIFQPLRNVTMKWFGSLMAYSFMGVVGTILFAMMNQVQFLTKTIGAGENGGYMVSCVFSLLVILVMVQIPGISTGIWGGIQSQLAQAMMVTSTVGGLAAGAAVGGTGAGMAIAGKSVQGAAGVAGMMNRFSQTSPNMKLGARLKDSFLNRSKGTESLSPNLAKFGNAAGHVGSVGADMVMGTMPSAIQNASKAISKGGKRSKGKSVGGVKGAQNAPRGSRPISMPITDQHSAIQDYVNKQVGPEKGAALKIPENWTVSQRGNQTVEQSIQGSARALMQQQGMIDKKGENKIAGRGEYTDTKKGRKPSSESKDGDSPMSSMPSAIQSAGKTVSKGPMGPMAKGSSGMQNSKEGSTQINMPVSEQHGAIRDYVTKQMGAEKGGKLEIPEKWKVSQRANQTQEQAIQGSARALMQQQGLIDKKGESKIADRGKYTETKKGRKPSGESNNSGTENPDGKDDKGGDS